jgi:hypothetical protein
MVGGLRALKEVALQAYFEEADEWRPVKRVEGGIQLRGCPQGR